MQRLALYLDYVQMRRFVVGGSFRDLFLISSSVWFFVFFYVNLLKSCQFFPKQQCQVFGDPHNFFHVWFLIFHLVPYFEKILCSSHQLQFSFKSKKGRHCTAACLPQRCQILHTHTQAKIPHNCEENMCALLGGIFFCSSSDFLFLFFVLPLPSS